MEGRKIIVLFDDPLKGFTTIKKLQDSGFQTKSFKLSTLIVEKIDKQTQAVILSFKKPITGLIKVIDKLKHHTKRAIFIAITPKENFSLWEKSGVDYIAETPSKAIEIINTQKKPTLHIPIHSKHTTEEILKQYKKPIKILLFYFDNFDDELIEKMTETIKGIYNNLKRADGFIIIEGTGFIVIPYNQNESKGIEILMKKIESTIQQAGFLQHLTISNIVNYNPQSDSLEGILSKKKKDIEIAINIETKTTPIEELLKLPFIVNSAIEVLDGQTLAKLYYDKEFRRIINPFIDIKSARLIAQLKGKVDEKDIKEAKDRFTEVLKEAGKYFDENRRGDFFKTLNSNIQLFSLPEVQSNIIMLINEEAPFKKIINEIQKDAAITTKILKFANSAFFGLKREVKSIEKAAIMLGTEEILGISLSISYLNFFNSTHTKKLYKYSIACLAISKFIEEEAEINTGATLASVIHSIGDMFYAQYHPEEYKKLIDYVNENNMPYEFAELRFLPAASVNVGYELAVLWNLPKRITKTIKYHLYPAVVSRIDSALHLIHASSIIAKAMGYFYGSYSIDNLNYHTYNLFLNRFKLNLLTLFEKQGKIIKQKIDEMLYVLS
ncbi:HDOD domain-containing protein [Hippea sp. KM1]|uniref:HDOD domain-containing protein n=1 Tax=Hippea sp. KM1 TaxID=944481 RepID=UPI00046D7B75|nr:HDOD domain-containing protein [Hippea sp. KM1]